VYRKYAGLALPRHTSYPIAPAWRKEYRPADFRADLAESARQHRPLSLYVHVPFCEKLCYYCACTKEIISAQKRQSHDPVPEFLDGIESEARKVSEITGRGEVHQVHLGGGSPTYLTSDQLEHLWRIVIDHFDVAPQAEVAVEIDPRITTRDQLCTLRRLGFNRVSLGVQDFSRRVQRAVNRVQPVEVVNRAVRWCRELGFLSVNFDLIYGLPFQTVESMAETLQTTATLAPDRIAFYRLAVIPEIFRWQNVFKATDLPEGDLSLKLNLLAIRAFQEAGYEFIGLDHFARPTEGLAMARDEKTLHRNFQGMSTGKNLDLIGLGPSAISQLENAFAQNYKTSVEWRACLGQDLATERGLHLGRDDRIRREVMNQLYGYGVVQKSALEAQFGIEFESYFASEIERLGELSDQGIVLLHKDAIRLSIPLGRLLVRVVAAVFDAYLPAAAFREGLPAHLSSKVG